MFENALAWMTANPRQATTLCLGLLVALVLAWFYFCAALTAKVVKILVSFFVIVVVVGFVTHLVCPDAAAGLLGLLPQTAP